MRLWQVEYARKESVNFGGHQPENEAASSSGSSGDDSQHSALSVRTGPPTLDAPSMSSYWQMQGLSDSVFHKYARNWDPQFCQSYILCCKPEFGAGVLQGWHVMHEGRAYILLEQIKRLGQSKV